MDEELAKKIAIQICKMLDDAGIESKDFLKVLPDVFETICGTWCNMYGIPLEDAAKVILDRAFAIGDAILGEEKTGINLN